MEGDTQIPDKNYHFLKHLFDTSSTQDVHEFIMYSEIHIESASDARYKYPKKLHVIVNPEIYKKYNGWMA